MRRIQVKAEILWMLGEMIVNGSHSRQSWPGVKPCPILRLLVLGSPYFVAWFIAVFRELRVLLLKHAVVVEIAQLRDFQFLREAVKMSLEA